MLTLAVALFVIACALVVLTLSWRVLRRESHAVETVPPVLVPEVVRARGRAMAVPGKRPALRTRRSRELR